MNPTLVFFYSLIYIPSLQRYPHLPLIWYRRGFTWFVEFSPLCGSCLIQYQDRYLFCGYNWSISKCIFCLINFCYSLVVGFAPNTQFIWSYGNPLSLKNIFMGDIISILWAIISLGFNYHCLLEFKFIP